MDPYSSDARLRYTRALRERKMALDLRGPQARELPAFEQVMAEHGSRFARARREAALRLLSALEPAFSSMAQPGLELRAKYKPGGTEDPAEFAAELLARRTRDARQRAASFGPQRDEVQLVVDGRSARHHASQGQQRILTLALKVAEL